MKKGFQIFGAVTLVGSVAAGAYYFLFMRSRQPQVEMYFDDGSMLAMPGDTAEAASFMEVASEVLKSNPIAG